MAISIIGGGGGGITVETDPTALKLVGGTITGNLNVNQSLVVGQNISLQGFYVQDFVASYVFSGNSISAGTQTGTATVDFTDPLTSTYYYTGGQDYNGQDIPAFEVSTTPVSVFWDSGNVTFGQTLGETTYTEGNVGSFYTDGVGLVEVTASYGGLSYNYAT